jgi:hypothetical protein
LTEGRDSGIIQNQEASITIVSDWFGIKVVHNDYGNAVFALFEKVMPVQLYLSVPRGRCLNWHGEERMGRKQKRSAGE